MKEVDVKKEIQEFVEELLDCKSKKGHYISAECLRNFTEEYISNFDTEDYKQAKNGELSPFVFMSTEVCWLSPSQIKKGKKCKIVNKEFTTYFDKLMSDGIKAGNFQPSK